MMPSILFALTLVVSAAGQPPKPPVAEEQGERPPYVRKVFEIKYADGDRLRSLLQVFGVAVTYDRELKAITVAGSQDAMTAVEEVVKRLDVAQPPAKNIEITAFLLVASAQPGPSEGVPAELEPVVTQLKGVFPYRSFRLWETVFVRTRDGQARGGHVVGAVPDKATGTMNASYEFGFFSATLEGDTVRIDQLRLSLFPNSVEPAPKPGPAKEPGVTPAPAPAASPATRIETNVDVRAGQKVVVGKANMDRAGNALILVLTAQVVP